MNATDNPRSDAPSTSRTTGRAVSSLITNSPIAAITATNITHRATSSCGVTAVAEMFGTRNCGAGPGLGPTAYVNAPSTGWPSTEIARQKIRYHPSGRCDRSGTTSVSGLAGDRCTGPSSPDARRHPSRR